MTTALELAIADMRADPEMQRFDTADDIGGCWDASQRFAWHCARRSVPYLFRRWRNVPGLRTPLQHSVEVNGEVIDWTYRQIVPDAPWPHRVPFAAYRAQFGAPRPLCPRCGFAPHPVRKCHGISRSSVEAIARDPRLQRQIADIAAAMMRAGLQIDDLVPRGPRAAPGLGPTGTVGH